MFDSEKSRLKRLRKEGCADLEKYDSAALASAHLDLTKKGEPRLSMVIKPHATKATWAHECSHVADFVCDVMGLPISIEATEVRAYIVGHLFAGLEEIADG